MEPYFFCPLQGHRVTTQEVLKVLTHLMTTHDVANKLNVSERTVKRLIRSKKIRSIKVGNLRRFRPVDVEAFIKGGADVG